MDVSGRVHLVQFPPLVSPLKQMQIQGQQTHIRLQQIGQQHM